MYDKTVLLVDDEQPILDSLSHFLEINDFSVKTATSGEEALAQFRAAPVNLVVTDLVMDGMGGIDVLQEIKKIKAETPVFILTGQGNMNLAIQALRSGADDFIEKPYDVEELIEKMEIVLEKQETLKKIKTSERYLPICMFCKKVRDDSETVEGEGEWLPMEEYLCKISGSHLTHGVCSECFYEKKGDWLGS